MENNFLIIILLIIENSNILIILHWRIKSDMNHYQILCHYLNEDVLPTFKNIKVVSYSVVSVLIIGAAGIWMPWLTLDNMKAILPGSTVFTYVLALLGSLVCNKLFFHSHKYNEVHCIEDSFNEDTTRESHINKIKYFEKSGILSAWGILAGSLIIVLTAIAYSKSYDQDSFLGFLSLILSWILYYLATASEIRQKTDPGGKGSQDAVPIIPSGNDNTLPLDADFFQTGKD